MTVTLQLQVALLPEGSTNTYVTTVGPVLKKSPDVWELDSIVAVPELSVALGCTQVTVVRPVPGGEARGMVTS